MYAGLFRRAARRMGASTIDTSETKRYAYGSFIARWSPAVPHHTASPMGKGQFRGFGQDCGTRNWHERLWCYIIPGPVWTVAFISAPCLGSYAILHLAQKSTIAQTKERYGIM